jgi:branched-subunit amino acid aminotransferase/4-amino-4-deoxychorismate lyase
MTEPIAWINGVHRPFSQAAVPVWDMGVVAGAAVTEMARTYRHRPFRLEKHVQRLVNSLRELNFPQPFSANELTVAATEIVAQNVRRLPEDKELGIVLFSTAGSNPTYLGGDSSRTTTVIHTFELPFHLWKSSFENGVRLQTPSMRQIPAECFPVTHKVRNRLHWILADQEASRIEPGSKALLLDSDGFVTETSTSCFFVVHDGKVATSSRGVLKSLSGEIVEELAEALKIPFERRPIPAAELETADEAFVSSTPVGLLPVSYINGRQVGTRDSRSIFLQLSLAWNSLTGIDSARQILQT